MTATAKNSKSDGQRDPRMNIRMSKLSRILQSEMAKTNWTEMAKMLFRGDTDKGRQEIIGKLPSYKLQGSEPSNLQRSVESKTTDQMQHLLVLLFILTIAEKRTQEAYHREFSERCDAISLAHGLAAEEYWTDGKVPVEWQKLDAEFEQRSVTILADTLREYSMHEIAERVAIGGAEEFVKIIHNIELMSLEPLKHEH